MGELGARTPTVEQESIRMHERVRHALADHFLEQGHGRIESYEVVRVIARLYSSVSFVDVRTPGQRMQFVVKTVVHHPANTRIIEDRNQALVEYDILERLHPAFQDVEGCSVPRPVLVIPEIETYVMEFVRGTSLADEMRCLRRFSSRRRFETLKRHYLLCGRWLKHFQQVTGVGTAGPESATEILQRCEDAIGRIEDASDGRCPRSFRDRVTGDLEYQLSLLGDARIPLAGRHGDFGPWNVLASEHGITVIDFLGYEEDPVPVDLLDVLVGLENERVSFTSSRRRVDALRKAFLEGYGELPSVPRPLLIICETLQRLGSLGTCVLFKGGKLHHRLERRILFRRHLAWLLNPDKRKLTWPAGSTQTTGCWPVCGKNSSSP